MGAAHPAQPLLWDSQLCEACETPSPRISTEMHGARAFANFAKRTTQHVIFRAKNIANSLALLDKWIPVHRFVEFQILNALSAHRTESPTIVAPTLNGMAQLASHQHGKGKVRVARVWRDGDAHTFVEWSVNTVLESDMAHAFLTDSNEGMTATDTQKNTVYYIAKHLPANSAPEDFAIALAKHFVDTYPLVSKAKIWVEQMNWERIYKDGTPHKHAYQASGAGMRTAHAAYASTGSLSVQAGVTGWKVLKTTQSGYAGFLKDEYTRLKDTSERIVATSVTATWTYTHGLPDYHAAYTAVKDALADAFFGCPQKGIFSPSVQFTLFRMGEAAVRAVAAVESISLNMPNLHFLPCDPVNSEPFADDVYVATSEPHGTIEATVRRQDASPRAKL